MTNFNTQSGLNFIGRYDFNNDGLSRQELQMGQMASFFGAMTSMMSGNQAGFQTAMQDLQFASIAGQNFDILSQASQSTAFGDNNTQTINPIDLMKTASNDGNMSNLTPYDVKSQNQQNIQNQNPMMQMFMMFIQMMMQMMGMEGMIGNNNAFTNNGYTGNNSSNILGWDPMAATSNILNGGNYNTGNNYSSNNYGNYNNSVGASHSLADLQPTNSTRNPGPGTFGGKKLTQEQVNNARIIAEEGAKMGASKRDISIAIATAMQESSLKNINYGDRDSVGLFQQRPSCGWGSVEQCTNPRYAARQFYSHLLKDGNRHNKSLTKAAQDVQRSAYPNAYAKWENMAVSLTNSIC